MPVYLDEDMVGSDTSELIFPHLLLCMGVACQLSNGRLVGCHISNATTEPAVLAELRRQIESDPGSPKRLYMIADFSQHFLHTKHSFTAKARDLGYTGQIFVLDTKPVLKRDGAFARVVSSGGAAPGTVYILADEDARPYSMVVASKYTGGGEIVEVRDGTAKAPRFIKTGDSAPRPGTAVDPSAFKIAVCH